VLHNKLLHKLIILRTQYKTCKNYLIYQVYGTQIMCSAQTINQTRSSTFCNLSSMMENCAFWQRYWLTCLKVMQIFIPFSHRKSTNALRMPRIITAVFRHVHMTTFQYNSYASFNPEAFYFLIRCHYSFTVTIFQRLILIFSATF
jgi:hypothetical protein